MAIQEALKKNMANKTPKTFYNKDRANIIPYIKTWLHYKRYYNKDSKEKIMKQQN